MGNPHIQTKKMAKESGKYLAKCELENFGSQILDLDVIYIYGAELLPYFLV